MRRRHGKRATRCTRLQLGPTRLASSTPADRSDPAARSNWRPLSLQPDATRERLAWYIALLFGFLVVRQRVADPERYQLYRGALFAVFIALAAFVWFGIRTRKEEEAEEDQEQERPQDPT